MLQVTQVATEAQLMRREMQFSCYCRSRNLLYDDGHNKAQLDVAIEGELRNKTGSGSMHADVKGKERQTQLTGGHRGVHTFLDV